MQSISSLQPWQPTIKLNLMIFNDYSRPGIQDFTILQPFLKWYTAVLLQPCVFILPTRLLILENRAQGLKQNKNEIKSLHTQYTKTFAMTPPRLRKQATGGCTTGCNFGNRTTFLGLPWQMTTLMCVGLVKVMAKLQRKTKGWLKRYSQSRAKVLYFVQSLWWGNHVNDSLSLPKNENRFISSQLLKNVQNKDKNKENWKESHSWTTTLQQHDLKGTDSGLSPGK